MKSLRGEREKDDKEGHSGSPTPKSGLSLLSLGAVPAYWASDYRAFRVERRG